VGAGKARAPRARRGEDFDVRLLDGRREAHRYRVADGEQGLRLDQFLAKRLSWRSRTSARKLLDEGLVALDGRNPRASRRVNVGEIVTVTLPRPVRDEYLLKSRADDLELPRLFEDEHLIVIDKPAGVPVHPSGRLLHFTVITALHRAYRNFDDASKDVVPKLCHRLDLETSGVLVVAKNHQALVHVQQQFEKRTVGKEYLVLVHGAVEGEEGLIDLPIGPALGGMVRNARSIRHDVGQAAKTRWRVDARWPGYTRLHIQLLTGRHHQIRVHLSAVGHPVVGDKIYGKDENLFIKHNARELTAADLELLELPRQALHSHSLDFDHPTQGPMRLESPWPEDLTAFSDRLESDR
jgi:23S rRNA pseudouridine1911/1915/1917 synthase